MLNAEQYKIVEILLHEKDFLKSIQLSLKLECSAKTVQRYISIINTELVQHGAYIDSKRGKGYKLIITDHKSLRVFLQEGLQNANPVTQKERVQYIIKALLNAQFPIAMDDLAESLYISESLILNDLRVVKEYFQSFSLKVIKKKGRLSLTGNELDFRNCMADFYAKTEAGDQTEPNSQYDYIISNIIEEIINEDHIKLSDMATRSLVIHLIICLERIKAKNVVTFKDHTINLTNIKNSEDYHIVMIIKKRVKEVYNLDIPESELIYLTLHLQGKNQLQQETDAEILIDDNIKYYVNIILRAIYDETKIDFYYDANLKVNLGLHVIPFLQRIENHTTIRNPIINDIKNKYSFAYELASVGLSALCEKLNIRLSEDEICFFALHFILALERQQNDYKPCNILVVCSTGKASSELLALQLQNRYKNRINCIKILELNQLYDFSYINFDCIVSTVPIRMVVPIPVFYVDNLLSSSSSIGLDTFISQRSYSISIKDIYRENLFFTKIDGRTKQDVLDIMIKNIQRQVEIPDDFLDFVMEREKFSSTELENHIAIPHPNKACTEDTFVSVGILEKPILWYQKKVQIIFLISVSKHNKRYLKELYQLLTKFINNEDNVICLLQNPNYEYFIKLAEEN